MTRKKMFNSKLREQHFSVATLLATFVLFAVFTTIQMLVLGKFIDYERITNGYVITIVCYWLMTAVMFTLTTSYQINRRYEKPMRQFAQATKQVANGDFSVYLKPTRTNMYKIGKMDYIDMMLLDFNTMVEELGSIETLKTDFFSSVSHEIKTPLSVIQNYAEALQNENLTKEQQKEYTDTILISSKRLSALITNILKLNKLDKQTIKPITKPYDLCRQLCNSALFFENSWEEKNIEFVADIEDCVTIEADESLMELVWSNLLGNAIKFTSNGGTVTLKQTSSNNEVIVSISDTGIGMSEEIIKHIFDKFYQGDQSHSTAGNGLGLALVLRVLQLVDVSITVESKLGRGSTFTVHIPVNI